MHGLFTPVNDPKPPSVDLFYPHQRTQVVAAVAKWWEEKEEGGGEVVLWTDVAVAAGGRRPVGFLRNTTETEHTENFTTKNWCSGTRCSG